MVFKGSLKEAKTIKQHKPADSLLLQPDLVLHFAL